MTGDSIDGFLFAPASARGAEARIVKHGTGLALVTRDGTAALDPATLRISERVGQIPRRISWPDGRVFETADNDGVDRLILSGGRDAPSLWLARMERYRGALMVAVAGLVALGIAGFVWGLPAFTEAAAALFPTELEARIGRDTLQALDDIVLRPSALPPDRQAKITAIFDGLTSAAAKISGYRGDYALLFRKGGALRANAFALPGGTVVVTDELIELSPSDDALAGVLAHEMGHVIGRHGVKRLIYAEGLSVADLLMGGGTTSYRAVAGASTMLLNQAYSRDFEREADVRATEILKLSGRDPDALADMLEALAKDCGASCDTIPWLSNHPGIAERVRSIRAHGSGAT